MKIHLISLIALVSVVNSSLSQPIANTEYSPNNIRGRISSNGTMFSDNSIGMAGFEAPANTGVNSIFISGLWVGGIDESDELRMSSFLYRTDIDLDYSFYGPVQVDGTANS